MQSNENGDMKRALATGKNVVWDETNLAENERIKAELNPTKINEPKTPYHSPLDTDDDHDAGESATRNLICMHRHAC